MRSVLTRPRTPAGDQARPRRWLLLAGLGVFAVALGLYVIYTVIHPKSFTMDPVDLAVAMSGDLAEEELRGMVEDRHRALTAQLQFFRHERERTWAGQTVADSLILQHAIDRLDAEIRWHDQVLDAIPKLAGPAAAG